MKIAMHIGYSLPNHRLDCGDAMDSIYFPPIADRRLRLVCNADKYSNHWSEYFPGGQSATFDTLSAMPTDYRPANGQALRERLAESRSDVIITFVPVCAVQNRRFDRRDDGNRAEVVAHLSGLTCAQSAQTPEPFPILRSRALAAFGG